MDRLLGRPLDPPPPSVVAIEPDLRGTTTIREQLEAHRKDATCASCHRIMDPLGFSLENFDAVGQWRTKEEAGPVDASGQLADGTPVDGPVSLRRALMRHPEQFVQTMTEKLVTYALGRGLDAYDMPAIRTIVRQSALDNYRFSAVILEIVKSTPFRMKKAQE